MKSKTTGQLVEEAFARRGFKRLHIEPASLPNPAKAKEPRRRGDNGKTR